MNPEKVMKTVASMWPSHREAAHAIGISPARFSAYMRGNVKRIPGEIAVAIEKATKGHVRRDKIRPDLYKDYVA